MNFKREGWTIARYRVLVYVFQSTYKNYSFLAEEVVHFQETLIFRNNLKQGATN